MRSAARAACSPSSRRPASGRVTIVTRRAHRGHAPGSTTGAWPGTTRSPAAMQDVSRAVAAVVSADLPACPPRRSEALVAATPERGIAIARALDGGTNAVAMRPPGRSRRTSASRRAPPSTPRPRRLAARDRSTCPASPSTSTRRTISAKMHAACALSARLQGVGRAVRPARAARLLRAGRAARARLDRRLRPLPAVAPPRRPRARRARLARRARRARPSGRCSARAC